MRGVGKDSLHGRYHGEFVGVQDQTGATNEDLRYVASPQRLARLVQGDKGAGTSRVEGDAGPSQVEDVRDAVGYHRRPSAREAVPGLEQAKVG